MTGFLNAVVAVCIPLFIVSSMLAIGSSVTWRQVITPLRNRRLLAAAVGVNFLVAPGLAWLLAYVFALSPPHATGLILLGVAAGAPFLPKLVEVAHADLPSSVALMVMLTVATILLMPLALPFLIADFDLNAWAIAKPLLVTMLLPLACAMALRHFAQRFCARCRPAMTLIANLSLAVLMVLLIGLNARAFAAIVGSGAMLCGVLLSLFVFMAGYTLGGGGGQIAGAVGLAAGARNVGAALPIATANGDPRVVVMLLAATLAGIFVLLIAARWVRRRGHASA